MRIVIVDKRVHKDLDLAAGFQAVSRQVREHVSQYWDVTLEFVHDEHAAGAVLDILDEPPADAMANTMGDHTTVDGHPYSWVAVGGDPALWTVTLSHEVLEMLVNPYARRLVPGFHPLDPAQPVNFVQEICDPVWGLPYDMGGLKVCSFVTPAWFDPFALPGVATWFDGNPRADLGPGLTLVPGGMVMLQTIQDQVRFLPPNLGAEEGLPANALFKSARHVRWAAGPSARDRVRWKPPS